MFQLTKIANFHKISRSYDARRNRQFKKILDSLYAGRGNWETELQQSGQRSWPTAYHGVRVDDDNLLKNIEREGLKYGPFAEFGEGVFMGTKGYAQRYARHANQLIDRKTGNVVEPSQSFFFDEQTNNIPQPTSFANQKEFERSNPELKEKYYIKEGPLFSLKTPYQLRGTNVLYPKQPPKVYDINPKKGNIQNQLMDIGVERMVGPDYHEEWQNNNPWHTQRYGTVSGKSIFDAKRPSIRREFFFDKTNIPANLLNRDS